MVYWENRLKLEYLNFYTILIKETSYILNTRKIILQGVFQNYI